MIWVGEEDHLRIISILQGNDLGIVDCSLLELLRELEEQELKFVEHKKYGVITGCPSSLGTSKRQSIFGKFPNLTQKGKNPEKLKNLAKQIGLQARGVSGEHSKIDEEGKSDISPLIRFGATESLLTKILFEGLRYLYKMEDKIKPKL